MGHWEIHRRSSRTRPYSVRWATWKSEKRLRRREDLRMTRSGAEGEDCFDGAPLRFCF